MKLLSNKKIKNVVLSVLVALMALSIAFGVMLSAKPVSAETANVSMVNGAYVRTADPMGIGFVTKVNKNYYDTAINDGKTVTTGTIIFRAIDVEGKELSDYTLATLTKASVKVADIPNQGWLEALNDADNYAFRGSVVNLTVENKDVVYCARGYIEVDGAREYTAYNAEYHSRSISALADAAFADCKDVEEGEYTNLFEGKYYKLSETELTYLKTYATVTEPEQDYSATHLFKVTAGSVDKLTASNVILKEFVNATDVTALGFNGDYQGNAIKLTKNDATNNLDLSMALTQEIYDLYVNDYATISIWYAQVKDSSASGNNVVRKDDKNFLFNTDLTANKTMAESTWEKISVPVSALDGTYANGVISLINTWIYANSVVYIGDMEVTYDYSDNYLFKASSGSILNAEKATVRYINEQEVAALNYSGGYTGGAMELTREGSAMSASIKIDSANWAKWSALENYSIRFWYTRSAAAEISFQMASNSAGYLFNVGSNFTAGQKVTAETWTYTDLDIATLTTSGAYNAETGVLGLYYTYANVNSVLYVGDIELIQIDNTDYSSTHLLKVNELTTLSLTGNAELSKYYSEDEVAELGYEGGYTGAAIAVGRSGGSAVRIAIPMTADEFSTLQSKEGYNIRLWYASLSGNCKFQKVVNSAGYLYNIGANITGDVYAAASWQYVDIAISSLSGLEVIDGYLPVYYMYNASGAVFLVGDIELVQTA